MTALLTKIDVNRTRNYITKFEEMVNSILLHPDRPRALLRGDNTKEDDIAEFLDTAVLQLQNLHGMPPDEEIIEKPLEPGEVLVEEEEDEEKDEPMSINDTFAALLQALVRLVAIEEDDFGGVSG